VFEVSEKVKMQYSLAYGKGQLHVELPEKNVVKVFSIRHAEPLKEPFDAVFDKLDNPTEAEPLETIARGKHSACIVVSDITRPVPNQIILPPILQILEEAGIDRPNITILVGTGLHRESTKEEKIEMFGEHIVDQYRITDHNARKLYQHEYLGVTKNGVPIYVDKRYLEADVKILTGLIEPHFMAGFSGGRKAICPGITAAETICPWHSPKFLEHPQARFGVIDGNPVHTEQMEVARKAGCDFIVNVIIDHDRNILAVVGGNMNKAHLEGVKIAKKFCVDSIAEPVDVVVTSAAGYPLDKTWYQTVKGIVAAVDILKPGGTIIIASACEEGVGSKEFDDITSHFTTIQDFIEAIKADKFFSVDQWQVEELAKALNKGKVKVFSQGLPPEVFQRFYVAACESVEAAVAEALTEYGPAATIAVVPDGPYVLTELRQS
jgi:nickel-dependent lactate racemase